MDSMEFVEGMAEVRGIWKEECFVGVRILCVKHMV